MCTTRQHDEAEFGGPFLDRVHLGEAALGLAGVGEHAADGDPGVELYLLGAEHARVGHGAFGGGEVAGAGVVEHAPARGPDQDFGVHLGRGQPLDELLGLGELLPAVPAGHAGDQPGPLGPEPGGPQRVLLLLQQAQRRLGDLQGAFALAAEAGGDGGLGQQVEPLERGGGRVAAAGRVHIGVVGGAQGLADLLGCALPQVQRPVQQPQLLGVGVPAAGGHRGGEDGGQGLGGVVGVVPVAGQPDDPLLGPDEGVVGFQGFGVAAVDAGAFAGQQVVADGLADEGVAEAVAVPVGGGEEDVGADGGPQGLDQLVLAEPGDGAQEGVLHGGAALGDGADHALGGLREHLDADEQQVAEGFGESGAAGALPAGGEFLDEEGVAVGAFEHGGHEGLVGPLGEDPGELAAHLGPVEAGQFDALDGAQPVQFGEQRAQRVAAVDVVGPVGGDEDEPAAGEGAEQVGQQVPGGGVRPVQVLQDQDEGAVGREPLQHPGRQFEEPGGALLVVRAARGLAELGQDPGELVLLAGGGSGQLLWEQPVQRAQGRRKRGEGKPLRPDLHTAADGHDGSVPAGLAEELLGEAGLADSGLSPDEQRLRLPAGGARQCVGEYGQFVGSADEHRADRSGLHAAEHRTGALAGGTRNRCASHHASVRAGRTAVQAARVKRLRFELTGPSGSWLREETRCAFFAARIRRYASASRMRSARRRTAISYSNISFSLVVFLGHLVRCGPRFASQGVPAHRAHAASVRAGGP